MNCANECSTAAIDTLQSSLETKLHDIKATLARIEQILSYSVRGNTSKKSLEKPIDLSRYMQLDTLYRNL
jgi:hypothetical protein